MGTQISDMFEGKLVPKVYRLETQAPKEELSDLAGQQDYRFFYLDGQGIHDGPSFIDECAKVMDFPDYFGRNWNALDECITDLEWCQAKGYVLLYDGVDAFAQADPNQWAYALDTLRSAADYWRKTDTPMLVLLTGTVSAVIDLETVSAGPRP